MRWHDGGLGRVLMAARDRPYIYHHHLPHGFRGGTLRGVEISIRAR